MAGEFDFLIYHFIDFFSAKPKKNEAKCLFTWDMMRKLSSTLFIQKVKSTIEQEIYLKNNF